MESEEVLHRFAHPFFTTKPIGDRQPVAGVGNRLTDYIKKHLEPVPAVKGRSEMTLENVLGKAAVTAIEKTGSIIFHAVGDTGHENGDAQLAVCHAMAADYQAAHPETSPALFVHLGDVNYYDNTDRGYHAQFYEPYKEYPGKIIAIPGNHDGELFKFNGRSTGQTKSLETFMNNFCLPKPSVPRAAGTIYRQMVNQPGVYWVLKSPFINIIGLYSNVAENPGYISGVSIGTKQKDWLIKTLKALHTERKKGINKALIIATHHPPLSHGGHAGSAEMLADIDDCCTKAGIMPDVFLSAHAHNYQRFTRTVVFNGKQMQIPFIVAGTGGRGTAVVAEADGSITQDHSYDKSLRAFGYLQIIASGSFVRVCFFQVNKETEQKELFDEVEVAIPSNGIPG